MLKGIRNSRWLNSTVFGIGMASLFSDLSHETVTSVLPALSLDGGCRRRTRTIEGVADGLSSVAKLIGGWWTDRLERRKPLCAGLWSDGRGHRTYRLSRHMAARSCRSWSRVGGARASHAARKALLAEAVTPETYGRAFGFERTMDSSGQSWHRLPRWA